MIRGIARRARDAVAAPLAVARSGRAVASLTASRLAAEPRYLSTCCWCRARPPTSQPARGASLPVSRASRRTHTVGEFLVGSTPAPACKSSRMGRLPRRLSQTTHRFALDRRRPTENPIAPEAHITNTSNDTALWPGDHLGSRAKKPATTPVMIQMPKPSTWASLRMRLGTSRTVIEPSSSRSTGRAFVLRCGRRARGRSVRRSPTSLPTDGTGERPIVESLREPDPGRGRSRTRTGASHHGCARGRVLRDVGGVKQRDDL